MIKEERISNKDPSSRTYTRVRTRTHTHTSIHPYLHRRKYQQDNQYNLSGCNQLYSIPGGRSRILLPVLSKFCSLEGIILVLPPEPGVQYQEGKPTQEKTQLFLHKAVQSFRLHTECDRKRRRGEKKEGRDLFSIYQLLVTVYKDSQPDSPGAAESRSGL